MFKVKVVLNIGLPGERDVQNPVVHNPLFSYFLSVLPKSIRKHCDFLMSSGGIEKEHREAVNGLSNNNR